MVRSQLKPKLMLWLCVDALVREKIEVPSYTRLTKLILGAINRRKQAGDPDVVAKCLKGDQVGNKTFKVHLDGHNLIPFFRGEVKESPRRGFLYWSDDGDVFAVRVGRWKVVFLEQLHEGLDVWRLGFEKLRTP